MHSFLSRIYWAALLAPAALVAQTVTTEGTLAVGGGTALQKGDRPAFQETLQHRKFGYGGIEEFRLIREAKDSIFKVDLRLIPGDDDYRVALDFTQGERFFASAGYEQYRVYYDGSGGYFRPTKTAFKLYDEDLSLIRSKLWAEVGAYTANKTLFKLRYDRRTRDGTKSSTHWADTNLVGVYGTRNVVPTFYDLDEETQTISFDMGNETLENVKWHAGARYSETKLNDKHFSRRRPFESADRIVTTKDETKTDIFAAHGFYERKLGEKLTVSAGALITNLDSNLGGSRIYGQSYDPVYDPAYLRRQQRDEGFYDLTGNGDLKQTVLNLNAVYEPVKNWSIRPSIRYENVHQETTSEFIETNIGAGPAFAAVIDEAEAAQKKTYDEFTEAVEVRYTGKPNWTFSGQAQWIQGNGDLSEDRALVENGQITIDRDSSIGRHSQKYSLNANWYAKPGLTFAAQYYFKGKTNDYHATRDNTPAGSADRYPAYIVDQDFETNDVNFRVSWRPVSLLNLVTRYDYQQSKIISVEAGLAKTQSSKYQSHIISESVTWSPLARLYVTGNVNLTYDQLATPAYAFVTNGDNNYVNGSLGGGYALAKLDDVYFDYTWFRASNFIDNSGLSLPYGLSDRQQAASLTWVRRQTSHLIYTLKYSYVTNRDTTSAGRNDFTAHVIYGKVQYHF